MVPRRPPQYFLADLVLLVIQCALFLVLITSFERRSNPAAVVLLMWSVGFVWATLRSRRRAVDCEECGRRFTPAKRKAGPILCALQGSMMTPCLERGISSSLAYGGARDELARLNRRMIAALGRGTALSRELFLLKFNDLTRLIHGSADHRKFQKLHQFNQQSWSLIEYISGEEAPAERKAAFRAFLRDKQAKTDQEEAFVLHFGYNFGPLLEGWRRWVLDRGVGPDEPPPARVRVAFLERRHDRTNQGTMRPR
jgi:hypothetical protein